MSLKKFLFVSKDGFIGDLAWQVKKEKTKVKYFVECNSQSEIANGLLEKVTNWENEIEWADLIIFDDVLGHGTLAEELRKKGKLVVGGTTYTDKLEDDRDFGQTEMKKHGIKIIPSWNFNSFDDAINFVEKNPSIYVIKPSGEAQNTKELLYVGQEENGNDVITILNNYKNNIQTKITYFQLQKKVSGIEVGIGAFFNGTKFINPININFEHKRLFPGNIGPNTGEMGTSMFWTTQNKLFNNTLKKMETKLSEEKYIGYIDINCIVDETEIYPLEWTSRFGYPTISIQQSSFKTKTSEFLYEMAKGNLEEFEVKNKFQVGVRIVVPPFPYFDEEIFNLKSKNTQIKFKDNKIPKEMHIEDVKFEDNKFLITGTTGLVLIICGQGNTIKKARKNVYKAIEKIMIPEMYYRNDIGLNTEKEILKLKKWGYLND